MATTSKSIRLEKQKVTQIEPRKVGQVTAIAMAIFVAVFTRLFTLLLAAIFAGGMVGGYRVAGYGIGALLGFVVYRRTIAADPQTSLLLQTIVNMLRNRSARTGLLVILALFLVSDFADVLATHNPIQSMIGQPGETGSLPRRGPCIAFLGCEGPTHWMGYDLNGRDEFSRVVFGAQTSLFVGFTSVIGSIVVGTFLGLIAGYAGGYTDNIIMRLMDVLLAFPSLLLAIAIVTVLGPALINALIAIAVVSIPAYARLSRASVLSVKEMEFVTAARALGYRPIQLLFGQIFPNTVTPLIVQGTLDIGGAVLSAAALSFLGLGAQPPTPEWGQMLSEARTYVFTAPHLVFFPGIAIMITVLGFNLLGDGLRDALDPRLRGN
jgi:ABC-type dipeptide/oligopeptide/nickel transport system permease subunit